MIGTMEPHIEEIKEKNAQELFHIINQYMLSPYYKKKISKFLIIKNEGDSANYNKNLFNLKKTLAKIKHSGFFLKYLHYTSDLTPIINGWSKTDPIEKTPTSHHIHASYLRIHNKTCFRHRDIHIGKPRPDIFLPEHHIEAQASNIIGNINRIYTILKPFGYDFPDILNIDDMQFRLVSIRNPNLDDPLTGRPYIQPETYTKLYKEHVRQLNILTNAINPPENK